MEFHRNSHCYQSPTCIQRPSSICFKRCLRQKLICVKQGWDLSSLLSILLRHYKLAKYDWRHLVRHISGKEWAQFAYEPKIEIRNQK